jgi:DNA-binding IclR family transcriptional regulator
MSIEIDVLRSLLRLARRRTAPTLDQLVERVGADESSVRRALVSLARGGLVQRTPAGLRLSLSGLAVAVACANRPRPLAAAGTVTASAPVELRSSRGRRRAA